MERKCPLCGATYNSPPALSHTANKTPICPTCGVRQALDAVGVNPDIRAEIVKTAESLYPEL